MTICQAVPDSPPPATQFLILKNNRKENILGVCVCCSWRLVVKVIAIFLHYFILILYCLSHYIYVTVFSKQMVSHLCISSSCPDPSLFSRKNIALVVAMCMCVSASWPIMMIWEVQQMPVGLVCSIGRVLSSPRRAKHFSGLIPYLLWRNLLFLKNIISNESVYIFCAS